MAELSEQSVLIRAPSGGTRGEVAGRTLAARAYLRRNQSLAAGLVLLFLLLAVGIVGPLFVDTRLATPLSALPSQPPSAEYPLGTDDAGRNLLAVVVVGLPLTMQVGFLAGTVGIGLGIILGLIAGYVGGWVDTVIRGVVDILLTVPGLVVLITIAASLKGVISIPIMALVVAVLAWMWPTRTIRAQVLSLREQPFVQMAKLSGTKDWQIRRRGLARHPGLGRPGGAGPGAAERADPGHDDLLGDLLHRADPGHVVVVADPDRADRAALHRPLPHQRRAG
jgi:ABC-type dipeptide/oligopeptide/nickel transport system permease subunit